MARRTLRPWADAVAGLAGLAERFPLIGLSSASRTVLLELNAHAGLRTACCLPRRRPAFDLHADDLVGQADRLDHA